MKVASCEVGFPSGSLPFFAIFVSRKDIYFDVFLAQTSIPKEAEAAHVLMVSATTENKAPGEKLSARFGARLVRERKMCMRS